jgi:hypothetical protein
MGLDMYLSVQDGTEFKEIGYWRKSNAIHYWFVNTLANGVDECQEIKVTHEDLCKLLDLCNVIKNNHEIAEELLPTRSGFFFGNTSYNEGYFSDIDETIKILTDVITLYPDSEFVYQASW